MGTTESSCREEEKASTLAVGNWDLTPLQRGLAMSKVIMIGCDLHDARMVLKLCCDSGASVRKSWETSDVDGLIEFLKGFAAERDAERIVFAYEASGQGFGLYDR